MDDINTLKAKVEALKNTVAYNSITPQALGNILEAIINLFDANQSSVAPGSLDKPAVEAIIAETKGVPGGMASLGTDGIVPSNQLPPLAVVPFDGLLTEDVITVSDNAGSGGSILFCVPRARFLCLKNGIYYTSWSGSRHFGEAKPQGVRAATDRIYIAKGSAYVCFGTGNPLLKIGAGATNV